MSKIEWTDRTWNPTTGCNKVSRGCKNCYAEVMHKRLKAMGQRKYKRPFLDGAVADTDSLREPLKWKKPAMVFVNSMSDLFHENIDFAFIDQVFAVMAATPQHTYQILTKRPERMAEYFAEGFRYGMVMKTHKDMRVGRPKLDSRWPLPNVWLGTSVENQEAANERIPHLVKCPAAVRFLSCEPLVGPLKLQGTFPNDNHVYNYLNSTPVPPHIHWVIAGGESGSKAAPMHPDWVRSLRDQCQQAGVAFFFKQWGAYGTTFQFSNGTPTFYQFHSFQSWVNKAGSWMRGNICVDTKGRVLEIGGDFMRARDENAFPVVLMKKMGKSKSGRLLDGVTHDGFPNPKTI